MNKLFLILLISLFTITSSHGDTIVNKKEKSAVGVQNTKQESSKIINASDAYKLLYENSKETNIRTISIIQWVIGITVAFLLAILGSQIFFNYRLNRKEVDYIKKDLDEKLAKYKSNIQNEISSNNKTTKSEINEIFEKLSDEIKKSIKNDFDEKSKFLDMENKFFKSDIERQIKQLTVEVEKNSGDIWGLKGIESNALSSFIRVGLLKFELNQEAKYILDDIIEILEKLRDIHTSDYKRLNDLISKMPVKYKSQKEKIIELYKDKPVYKYVDNFVPTYPLSGLLNNSLIGLGQNIPRKQYIKNIPNKDD